MGNSEARHHLWIAIARNDSDTVREICLKFPEFINSPISDDQGANAATRAAYLDRPVVLEKLGMLGADFNKAASSGISPLMWAAARGNIESVRFLINFKANPQQQGPYNMTAIDFAILYGAYNTASFLYNSGYLPTKSLEQFIEIKNIVGTPHVKFSSLLISLEGQIPEDIVPSFIIPSIKRDGAPAEKLKCPKEFWYDWPNIVLDFERPEFSKRTSATSELLTINEITIEVKRMAKAGNNKKEDSDDIRDIKRNRRFSKKNPRRVYNYVEYEEVKRID